MTLTNHHELTKMEVHSLSLRNMMTYVEQQMLSLDDDSEMYKDLQYFHALLDIVYGSTEEYGGYENRKKDLLAVKHAVGNLTVML